MGGIDKFLKARRKSELQAIHQFWFPGESAQAGRDELEHRIAGALQHGTQLEEKLARLSRSQRRLLSAVVSAPEHMVECRALSSRLEAEGILPLELDNAARMLQERGFIARVRQVLPAGRAAPAVSSTKAGHPAAHPLRGRPPPRAAANTGAQATPAGPRDSFEVPAELATRLGSALGLARERMEPAHQISQRRFPFEIDFDGEDLEARVAGLGDPELARFVQRGIEQRGILPLGSASANGARAPVDDEERGEWRRRLEEAGIGTIGGVSLKDFGIQVEEPALVIFQEWIQRRARAVLRDVEEPDTVVEAGVDLYIDLNHVASKLEEHPAQLTRDGKLSRRTIEGLRSRLYLSRIGDHLEGDMAELVVLIARRLRLLESYAELLQANSNQLQVWRKLDLNRQKDLIQKLFLAESQGDRWSFHQEILRGILLECLREIHCGEWISLEALITLVVSTCLLELEEREVRAILIERRAEDFSRERLITPFHRLGSDLVYWVLHRYLLLGACELGYRDGRLQAFRLTPLGAEGLGNGAPAEAEESRLLVNPNFEIILFAEGLKGMRLELALARFGERISAERVRRYRVSRDDLRRGIHAGLSLAEIRSVLEAGSELPLPDPVITALHDWGKDHDWVLAVNAVLLKGLKPARARLLSDALKSARVEHVLCPDGTVVIGQDTGPPISEALERLRRAGWLIREAKEGLEIQEMTAEES